MTLEEENIALRKALNYASAAITSIAIQWVNTNNFTQITKVLERIKELTPSTSCKECGCPSDEFFCSEECREAWTGC